MSVKNALLALALGEPVHGYQLKTDFDAATGSAWPLNFGQVYTSLQRLERDGLLQETESDSDDKVLYAVTPDGRSEAESWLTSPVSQPLAGRDELSMKVLIAVATSIVDPIEILNIQRTAAMSTLQSIAALKLEASDSDLAWRLHLDRVSLMTEAEIRWLGIVEERLRASSGTKGTSANDLVDDREGAHNE